MAALLRSAARRLGTTPARRAAFSSAASPAPASGREGVIAAAAVAAAGSGLGLWFMPPALNDSGDASAGQISAAASAGAGAVEERHERRRRFLLGGESAVPCLPCCTPGHDLSALSATFGRFAPAAVVP
jgi:hypothetical protein